jgi:hypothetical protein
MIDRAEIKQEDVRALAQIRNSWKAFSRVLGCGTCASKGRINTHGSILLSAAVVNINMSWAKMTRLGKETST